MHVVAVERGGGRDRDRLLAGALHVEAGLPLALRAVHAVVEDAHGDHVAQHLAQRVGVELGVPRADRLMVVAEHADELRSSAVGLGRRSADVGPRRVPAAGIFSEEKSGVSPGRKGGSGTCSASFGALRLEPAGSLSLMVRSERLIRTCASGNWQ